MPSSIGHFGTNGPLPCDRCIGKQYNVCHLLEPERQRELFETGCRHRWDKRSYLFRAGSPVGAVFKVTSGIVAESRTLADGRRQIIAFFLPGDICGYLETDGRHAFDGEAITTAETCSFNRERFGGFVNRNNDVAEEMRRNLADRLKMAGAHLSVVGQLTSTERVANFVAMMTAAYAARNVQTRPLPLPMKRSDIADYLGLRLETVSRAFSKLRQHNIIDLNEDEVLILDQAKLNQLSNR
ncbi:MAG TPA: Crp/Fnr family transcriptional regulator [Reyranella sp.]|jgi:CRP/FNR family transcriptional regulator|nr:Crp/Fnr family transcriptional regulator [Reyranella sp.]